MKRIYIFVDGDIRLARAKEIEAMTPALIKGKGVFETMRSYKGRIFLLDEHLKRLRYGLKFLGLQCPYSNLQIKKYLDQMLRKNGLRQARVRLIVWSQKRNMYMAIIPVSYQPMPAAQYNKGYKVILSKHPHKKWPGKGRVKATGALLFQKAYQEAVRKRCNEALLLNHHGHVIEGSRTNLFLIKNGKLISPMVSSGYLKGVTRSIVLQIAKKFKISPIQRVIKPHDLFTADEAFVTNSVIEIMPVTKVDRTLIGTGRIGCVTHRFLREYRQIIHTS